MRLIILFLLLFPLTSFGSETRDYTLAELVSLHDQGNWREVLENIEDISPVLRDTRWTELLISSAEKRFQEINQEKNSSSLEWFSDYIVSRYPQTRNNQDFIFKLAKSIRQKVSNTEAIKYFNWALENGGNEKLCNDNDLKESVFSSLLLNFQNPKIKLAQQVAFGTCFTELKPTIKDAINKTKEGMDNACQKMIDKNGLSGITKKKCLRHIGQG